ncbi:unnamed protein product [Paramecium sonneborni]|uniref:Kinesin motor domain-containing protein n=1 Tax=Paramecium sonneborni TaxID=65129 RepID=A0A8S1RXW4_9CILI|nr:unnamed protein product [Paramecium sonneborni]
MEKISVCLRIRPLNQKEINDNEIIAWDASDSKIQLNKIRLKQLFAQKKVINSLIYEFNHCYGQQADNYYLLSTSEQVYIFQKNDLIIFYIYILYNINKYILNILCKYYNNAIFSWYQLCMDKQDQAKLLLCQAEEIRRCFRTIIAIFSSQSKIVLLLINTMMLAFQSTL